MPRPDDFDREILDIIPERFDADADSRMARKSARNRVLITVSLALLLVMAIGIAARHILFGEAPRDRQLSVPVIHADDKPIKVKPQDRGGMDVPNQDKLIYDQMAAKGPAPQPERLLPPPEQALTPPAANSSATAAMPPPKAITAAAPPPPVTVPVAPPAAVPVAPPMPAARTVAPPASAALTPTLATPTPAPAPPKAPPPVAAATAGRTGGWVVQLGAVHSEAEAKAEWARLRNMHKDQLSDLTSDIVRVDLGAKGIFWRVRGGPLDEAQARLLCAELTRQSQGCIIARK